MQITTRILTSGSLLHNKIAEATCLRDIHQPDQIALSSSDKGEVVFIRRLVIGQRERNARFWLARVVAR